MIYEVVKTKIKLCGVYLLYKTSQVIKEMVYTYMEQAKS